MRFLPHHIHGSSSHLWVAAHNRHAGSEGPVNAEHNKLCSSRYNSEIAVSKCVVTPARKNTRKRKGYVELLARSANHCAT